MLVSELRAGCSRRERSSFIQQGSRVEVLLLLKKSQLRWSPPGSGVPGMSSQEETCWRNYISHLAWECLGVPQDKLEEVVDERQVWTSLLRLTCESSRDRWKKMDG